MGAVAVAVGVVAVNGVVAKYGAPLEGLVLRVDAGVDYIGIGAFAGGGVVEVVRRARLAVRDAAEAPGGVGLGLSLVELPYSDGLDSGNLGGC